MSGWSVVRSESHMPDRGSPMRVFDKGAHLPERPRALVREALQAWDRRADGWPEMLAAALASLGSSSCVLETRETVRRNSGSGWMERTVEFRLSERSPEIVKIH